MTTGPVWDPGKKTHKDENFPVASNLVSKKHRAAILAFYRFARAGDDIADDPELSKVEKIRRLDAFEDTLLGHNDDIADALPLRAAIAERGLSPRHAQDLLVAFRMDASKHRYANWDELIHYCSYSANPVGRFVLDVHGESQRHLARERCAVHGASDYQSPAGLRRGLPPLRSRLHSARRARRAERRG